MDVLTALYELKDKSDSLGEDDKGFVLGTVGVHESGKRKLNPQEILRIDGLYDSTRGVKGACAHQLQAPLFTKSGEPTDEYECALCHRRFKTR
jgi:hypothetical protein